LKINSKHNGNRKETFLMVLMGLLLLAAFLFSAYQKQKNTKVRPTSGNNTAAEVVDVKSQNFDGSTLDISINHSGYERLAAKRKEALKVGLLFSSKDDFVDADIKIDGKEYACELRLKGDLLDHLRDDRWSFRIVLKGGEEWRGMKTFSIHNSKARSHTAEWIMHELFKQEGIVVPDYDFIKASVNGNDLGVYAFEHHFENQLLKRNERELGPILKHNDDGYWDNMLVEFRPFPWIEASSIDVFNKNNLSDPEFAEMAERSVGMLNDFLNDRKSVEEVFDTDLMAKYYALLDISHAWHAQQFTNIRFYLNPSSGKLEPIAFDCFGDHLPKVTDNWEAFGEGFNSGTSKQAAYDRANVYQYRMLKDKAFFESYMAYLNKFTNPTYLNTFKNTFDLGMKARTKYIRSDKLYKDFNPNFDKLFAKATFTKNKLLPKSNLSLKAYRVNGSKQEMELQAYHCFPLEILGFGTESSMVEKLDEPFFLEAYNPKSPIKSYTLKSKSPTDYIYYQTLGIDEIYKVKLAKTNAPSKDLPIIKADLDAIVALPFISKVGKQLIVDSGVHKINKSIVVPEGYELFINAGTNIHLVNGASLFSYSAMIAKGTASQPINFFGEGVSGMMVSTSEETSEFEHCNFVELGAFKNKNISSQGAVTIYKSKANFKNCHFLDLKTKEALSLRNSIVDMKFSKFKSIQGTAIKSSYSNLIVADLEFEDIGKNGISITSGNFGANNLVLRNVLNKAMNFTDNAEIYIFKVDVFDSYQGLYINGQSNAKVFRFWIENIEKGIEVRSSNQPDTKLELGNFKHKNVKQLYLIKQGLSVMVNGKKEKG